MAHADLYTSRERDVVLVAAVQNGKLQGGTLRGSRRALDLDLELLGEALLLRAFLVAARALPFAAWGLKW